MDHGQDLQTFGSLTSFFRIFDELVIGELNHLLQDFLRNTQVYPQKTQPGIQL